MVLLFTLFHEGFLRPGVLYPVPDHKPSEKDLDTKKYADSNGKTDSGDERLETLTHSYVPLV